MEHTSIIDGRGGGHVEAVQQKRQQHLRCHDNRRSARGPPAQFPLYPRQVIPHNFMWLSLLAMLHYCLSVTRGNMFKSNELTLKSLHIASES